MWNTLKLGYAPTRRSVFSKRDALKYKDIVRHKIDRLGVQVVDLEGINEEGLLFDDMTHEAAVIERFRTADVDAVFFPHCNFGTEDAVARVAKAINKPVLLWGPRDEAPLIDGMRLRDTQCGLFATGKILRRFGVPFTYIVNSPVDSEVFHRGFTNFLAAANVVKAMKNMRILQIGPRPTAFWTMMCNEGELLEQFGVQVFPITLDELKQATLDVEESNSTALHEVKLQIQNTMDWSTVTEQSVIRIAALKLAMRHFAQKFGCSGIAIQCWSALQDLIGIMPCLANALLTDEGIPVTCETDIHGAITAVLGQAATLKSTAPFFADLTIRHPDNPNGELLFHCGNFPVSLSVEEKPQLREHFLFDSHAPGTHEGEIKGGNMSVIRFDGDRGDYQLFLGRGRGIQGPFTRGSYVWVEVQDWPLWEERLVTGPYVHHVVAVHSNIIPVLYEACKYIPGLKPDCVDPIETEIQAWLRGGEWTW